MTDNARCPSRVASVPVAATRTFCAAVLTVAVLTVGCARPSGNGDGSGAPRSLDDLSSTPDTLDLRFTDVTAEAGLTAIGSAAVLRYGESMSSGGAVADLNGDGFDDIFLARPGLPNVLYMNNGDGSFTDETLQAGLSESEPTYGSSAAAFFDADGDGHPDLFVTGYGRGRNRLYMNSGDGTFIDQTAERGLTVPAVLDGEERSQMHGVSVADVNGDGALDLLVLHWHTSWLAIDTELMESTAQDRGLGEPSLIPACKFRELAASVLDQQDRASGLEGPDLDPLRSRSRLFINDGAGSFTDATSRMGLDFDEVVAFTGTFADFDLDGWPDLAVSGDGCTSRLWRNVNGQRFEDVTETAGVGTDENGMGGVLKDIDGDGLADWFISSIAYGDPTDKCLVGGSFVGCSGNRLFTNNGDGSFTDSTSQSGLRDGGWGWGTVAEDFANTGQIQIAMTNGFADEKVEHLIVEQGLQPSELESYDRFLATFIADPSRFWMTDPSGRFHDVADQVGITDTGVGHGLIPFDYNNDGRMDLLIIQAGLPPILYRNDGPADRSWLTIKLSDPGSPGNSWGDGARVEVFRNDGGRDQGAPDHVGWITTSGSYESQKPPEFHLGFGDRTAQLARIDIYWPTDQVPQSVTDVELNQTLVIERATND